MELNQTVPAILFTVRDMVRAKFLNGLDVIPIMTANLGGHITDGEMVEMFQELVDVATIKKLCH